METASTFNGLGTYKNTIFLNNTATNKNGWGKHDLVNFYETSTEVQKYFSQGYRVDKSFAAIDRDQDGLTDVQEYRIGTNQSAEDTDGDGFSDGLEAKVQSNPTDAEAVPYTKGSSLVTADDRPFIAVVQTEDADGKVLGVKGVEMQPVRQDGGLVYTPSGKETDLGTDGFDWSAFESQPPATGTAVLQGTAGNDTLTGSLGSDTIIGGAGRDTFVFKAADVKSGSVDVLADFKAAEDRLDLTGLRPLFGDKGTPLKLSELLDDGTALPFDGAHLVLDKSAGTLAYKTSAADAGTVFLKMDADQAAALNAGNVLV